jgi:long-chain acyl-CoA synthetase
MQTLQDLLPEIQRLGNREAIRWTNGFRAIVSSYSDLYGSIAATTEFFRKEGLQKDDRVLIWAENRMDWAAVFWACVATGVVAVPVDFRFSQDLVQRIASESRSKLTIDEPTLDQIATCREDSTFHITPASPNDIVEIVYTSGTTGEPKGVTHRHRHICANLRPFQSEINKYKRWAWPFQPIRILDLLPLSHMFGQALGIYIPLLLGGAAVFTPETHPGRIIQIIRENRVTAAVAVPQILENLKNEVERRRLQRFREIHSAFGWKFWAFVAGGAPVDTELEEFWGKLRLLVVQGYGLTEASPVVAVNHPFDAKRGSLGKPLPGVDVKIAADGEILVRGESITTENRDWFHTGDLGAMDGEGRLYYRGRKKDLIVTPEGLNVHPEDVEHVLNQFPEIYGSAVVGVSRAGHEQVHAAVILNDPKVDVNALVGRANEKLEAHQRIRSWSIWPENDFPRTASTMKVRRGEVQSRIAGGRMQQPEKTQGPPEERDIGSMSSLERVELLSELENRYQTELNEDEFSTIKSSQELAAWLRRSTAPSSVTATQTVSIRPPSEWARALPVRMVRRAFQKFIAVPLFKHYLPLTVTGLEHFQGMEPPVLFAANHTSHLDAPAVFASLSLEWRRRLAPAMGLDTFRPYFHPYQFPATRVWWTGLGYVLALGLFNAYPLPQDLAGVRRALNYTGELIKRGYCPLVFPEGARTPDGKVHPFRPGIGMMAIRLGVPVVPIYIDGLYEIYSIRDSWPRLGPVRVSFGSPRVFKNETYEKVAQELQNAVQKLSA